ncbi:DUF6992 family protein [Hymenobacter yonginensis]|uniref:Uncharacterized protein n=1 Tax=Hymenobacter yonginensis TaxID=748197 RepID=A0ABY7PM14_9BACT|nr:hypothetical protein [Hymenobacter yonginensis]WBO83746.1 hypothetical protein O9Z63_15360 [Hymenobacter yonginensis]
MTADSLLLTASLDALNHARELLAERGMGVLGAWALLNLLVSGYRVMHTDPRAEARYFHLMNVGWAFVNMGIAVWGLLHANPNHVAGLPLADSLAAQFTMEKILLFNAGLDVAYVVCGSWLRARAATTVPPEKLLGYGRSLWLQGGFLLLFDVSFYLLYHRYANELLALVS